jgi:ELWxxDGT repeat protein
MAFEPLENRQLLTVTAQTITAVDPGRIVNFKGEGFFVGQSGGLWKTDGTVEGTALIKSATAFGGNAFLSQLTVSKNAVGEDTLYFVASSGGFDTAYELWKSNGEDSGTVRVKEFVAAPANPGGSREGYLTNLTDVNGTLFFVAEGTENGNSAGRELWKSNGETDGTVLVKDIFTGTQTGPYGGEYPLGSRPRNLTSFDGKLFFIAESESYSGMWSSDGTAAGTIPFVAPDLAGAGDLRLINGTLFFVGGNDTYGGELWKSNGTPAGTVMVKDINPGSASSSPSQLTNVNGTLYFIADDGAHGLELWKSNDSGTQLVKDIRPDAERYNRKLWTR